MPVLGRLVQDGLQTIVKAHWLFISLGRTLLLLYARVYNALSTLNLTPRNGTSASRRDTARKRGAGTADAPLRQN
jgi:hypothetical protein